MTELEEVFIIRAGLCWDLKGQVAPGCRLTMGGDGRMVGCSLIMGGKHNCHHQAKLFHSS